uniref:Major facilitator superfamily (MFS) profile domain-containing protein n=1 Tax=Megaselia scalaris TaxID=36166 RepID=T1GJ92_MEGSC
MRHIGSRMTLPMERAESFEKALELAKFGKFNILLICTAGIVMANIYLETTSMNVVLPVSQCDLHWTQKERNLLGAVSYIGIIISSHCWGFVGDTFGRKKVLVPTLLVGFVVSVISSFCNSFTCMFIFRLINGIW